MTEKHVHAVSTERASRPSDTTDLTAQLVGQTSTRRLGEIVLLGCVVLFGVAFLVSLRGLPFEAQLFPFVVICIMLSLSLTRLVLIVVTKSDAALVSAGRPEPTNAVSYATLTRSSFRIAVWAWAGGTVAAMLTVGIVPGTALSVFGYLVMGRRETWPVSLGIAAGVALAIYVVFGQVMEINLHTGFLLRR